MPTKLIDGISNRYKKNTETDDEQNAFFDTIRASVNLVVASILIASGTYLTIPLSTTFVVFMVAMGTSLADQAWGRENAVYRVSGVLSILGGWFIAASIAFVGSFALVLFIWWLKIYGVIILLIGLSYTLYRTNKYHKKIYNERNELKRQCSKQLISNKSSIMEVTSERIRKHILETSKIYMLVIEGFAYENAKQLKETCEKTDFLTKLSKTTKTELFNNFTQVDSDSFDFGHYFIQALGFLGELPNTLQRIAQPIYNHTKNHHSGLSKAQKEDALLLLEEVTGFFNYILHIEKEYRFYSIPEMIEKQRYILELIEDLRKKQIMRIMEGVGKTRSSLVLLECYAESKNLVLYTVKLIKAHRDFY